MGGPEEPSIRPGPCCANPLSTKWNRMEETDDLTAWRLWPCSGPKRSIGFKGAKTCPHKKKENYILETLEVNDIRSHDPGWIPRALRTTTRNESTKDPRTNPPPRLGQTMRQTAICEPTPPASSTTGCSRSGAISCGGLAKDVAHRPMMRAATGTGSSVPPTSCEANRQLTRWPGEHTALGPVSAPFGNLTPGRTSGAA